MSLFPLYDSLSNDVDSPEMQNVAIDALSLCLTVNNMPKNHAAEYKQHSELIAALIYVDWLSQGGKEYEVPYKCAHQVKPDTTHLLCRYRDLSPRMQKILCKYVDG